MFKVSTKDLQTAKYADFEYPELEKATDLIKFVLKTKEGPILLETKEQAWGNTLLHISAQLYSPVVAKALLDVGANHQLDVKN